MLSSRAFRSVLRVSVLLASLGTFSQAWAVPLSEVFASRAGSLIFGELYEGSLVANRILGTNIANPASRMRRLTEVLADQRMVQPAGELQVRIDAIERDFAQRYPRRVQEVFGSGTLTPLTEGERRLLRDLVSREFDLHFIQQMERESFQALRGRLSNGVPRGTGNSSGSSFAGLSPHERAFVFWETQKNAAGLRSLTPVPIENYEIPADLLMEDISARMPQELRDALIFERDGRKFVRWIINPEDTLHYKEVEKFLRRNGVNPVRHQTFEAYQTASRSYVIVDRSSGRRVVFTAKVSTNHTGGAWRDKKQPVQDAYEARRAADLVVETAGAQGFRNVVVMDEPAMFGIREIDQGMLIRQLASMPTGDVTYLPGFSAMHTDLGARIAHANGATDVAAFWNEHYNKPLARAIAELAAKTGLTYDSPHSQNFLIEMIGVNPTGRIVMRDFGDTYALADFFEATGRQRFLTEWEADNISRGSLPVSVGILHGNEMPTWMNEALYRSWGKDFYRVFEAEFSAITGVPSAELRAVAANQSGRYFSKAYPTNRPGWSGYFEQLRRSSSR